MRQTVVHLVSSLVVLSALNGCIQAGSDKNAAGSGGGAGASTAGSGGSSAGSAGSAQAGSAGSAGSATAGQGGSAAGSAGSAGSATAGSGGSSGSGGSEAAGSAGSSTAGSAGSSTAGAGGSEAAGSGGSSAGAGGSEAAGAGGSSSGAGGSEVAGSGGSSAGAGGSAGSSSGGGLSACTEGTLFAGNPYFNGDFGDWKPEGQPLLADPPLRYRHLAVSKDRVFIDTQTEVWLADGGNVRRLAGDEKDLDSRYEPTGTCADARFILVDGIAALPNGNVVVADSRGGGLVELKDPAGTCTVAPIAGNMTKILEEDLPFNEKVGNPGDVDGPGASAKFFGVRLRAVDAEGNLYVDDQGNKKFKKIANDASRTVTTLASYPKTDDYTVHGMTVLKGKLYVSGVSFIKDFLWEVDLATPGSLKVVYEKTGMFEEVSGSAVLVTMDNDGEALIVGSQKGYLFRLSTEGKALATLAGIGSFADYPELDLKKPVPADKLPLKTASDTGSVVRRGDAILWAGANGPGGHIFSIACH